MPSLPTETVTFLFTDIEGSTALLQRRGDHGYAAVLEAHRRLLRAAFTEGNGQEIDTLLSDAVRGLAARDLPPGVSLRALGPHRLRDLREPEHPPPGGPPGPPRRLPAPQVAGCSDTRG